MWLGVGMPKIIMKLLDRLQGKIEGCFTAFFFFKIFVLTGWSSKKLADWRGCRSLDASARDNN